MSVRFPDNPFLSDAPFVSVARSRRKIPHATGGDEIVRNDPDMARRHWMRYKTRNRPLIFSHSMELIPDMKTKVGNKGTAKVTYTGAPAEPVMQDVIETPP